MNWLETRILKILKSGRRPVIHLRPGMQIVVPRRSRPGRPRIRDEARPFAHYADPRACKSRARCAAPGCGKRLKKDQRGACSEACDATVFDHALYLLRILGVSREDLLMHYRGPKPTTSSGGINTTNR